MLVDSRLSCSDPDWLDDLEDILKDNDLHTLVWLAYKFPLRYKARLSVQLWEKVETKFNRCRRLEEKHLQIEAEIAETRRQERNKLRLNLASEEPKILREYPDFKVLEG